MLAAWLWARKVPAQVWLALLAVAFLAGWLHEHDAKVRTDERNAVAAREWAQRKSILLANAARDSIAIEQATDSARTLASALEAKTAFTLQRIVPRIPLPPPSVTPSGDSVTFSRSVWEGHVADDLKRDSTLNDLAAIARDGIPAIRNQYEAVLANDVRLFALKDSLIGAADARARFAAQMHPTSHWHAVLGPCYAVGPTGHHGVALCATVGWSPF